ncbi:Dihydrofolate reductase type 3 [Dyadobacter sp. CECT 9275]|uniref:Dihydrofolate reductase n=1 Tax=Dyadobacter helix TaxID=2822344 RepID=A0A916NCS1_9BACT|nr:dihydrofolate reductase [Dyadobacter sp. CECT 9275]CAG5003668.1 Dihydrofolate reductase type 3 [Dyadobacter sp. CECT 9275]
MLISIIVAVSENGVIGKDNQLIWRLPEDLKRFKNLTMGHPMIMGRKTFESIGKALPGRTSIVITRQKDFQPDGVIVVHSLHEAITEAKKLNTDEAFIIGGGEIYQQALAVTDHIYLTQVDVVIEGDTHFEISDPENWDEINQIGYNADEKHAFSFKFIDLRRKPVN